MIVSSLLSIAAAADMQSPCPAVPQYSSAARHANARVAWFITSDEMQHAYSWAVDQIGRCLEAKQAGPKAGLWIVAEQPCSSGSLAHYCWITPALALKLNRPSKTLGNLHAFPDRATERSKTNRHPMATVTCDTQKQTSSTLRGQWCNPSRHL